MKFTSLLIYLGIGAVPFILGHTSPKTGLYMLFGLWCLYFIQHYHQTKDDNESN